MNAIGIAIQNIFVLCVSLVLGAAWLAGFAINGSAWNIIPIYAWYVTLEKAMNFYHIFGYVATAGGA